MHTSYGLRSYPGEGPLETVRRTSWADLVPDVLQLVGGQLENTQLFSALQVCKSWRRCLTANISSLETRVNTSSETFAHRVVGLFLAFPSLTAFKLHLPSYAAVPSLLALHRQASLASLSLVFPVERQQCLCEEDMQFIVGITQLRALSLEQVAFDIQASLSPLSQLSRLSQLRVLHAGSPRRHQLQELLEAVGALPHLTCLAFKPESRFTSRDFVCLAGLTQLQRLELHGFNPRSSDQLVDVINAVGSHPCLHSLFLEAGPRYDLQAVLPVCIPALQSLDSLELKLEALAVHETDSPAGPSLELKRDGIGCLSQLSQLPNLVSLHLAVRTPAHEAVLDLERLTELTRLTSVGVYNGFGRCSVNWTAGLVDRLAGAWRQVRVLHLHLSMQDVVRGGGSLLLPALTSLPHLHDLFLAVGSQPPLSTEPVMTVSLASLPLGLTSLELHHVLLTGSSAHAQHATQALHDAQAQHSMHMRHTAHAQHCARMKYGAGKGSSQNAEAHRQHLRSPCCTHELVGDNWQQVDGPAAEWHAAVWGTGRRSQHHWLGAECSQPQQQQSPLLAAEHSSSSVSVWQHRIAEQHLASASADKLRPATHSWKDRPSGGCVGASAPSLPSLQRLRLQGCHIGEQDFAELCKGMRTLRVLQLERPRGLGRNGLHALSALLSLQCLLLDVGPQRLLDWMGPQLGQACSRLSRLRELTLLCARPSSCSPACAALRVLCPLARRLHKLHVEVTPATGILLEAAVQQVNPFCHVTFSNKQGVGPDACYSHPCKEQKQTCYGMEESQE